MRPATTAIGALVFAVLLAQPNTAHATTEKHVKHGSYSASDGQSTTSNSVYFEVVGKGTHKHIRGVEFSNVCMTQSVKPPQIAISKAGAFAHGWSASEDPSGANAYHVSLKGSFTKRNLAKGTLTIHDDGCSSTYHFKAKHPCTVSRGPYQCPLASRSRG